jgi:hypothetical protein
VRRAIILVASIFVREGITFSVGKELNRNQFLKKNDNYRALMGMIVLGALTRPAKLSAGKTQDICNLETGKF